MRAPVFEGGKKGVSRRVSGSITVYLSLTLLLVLSLVGTLLASASIQTAKNRSKAQTSLALESVFAEYDRELLERYHLFAYDAGRQGQDPETGTCTRLRYYGDRAETSFEKVQYLSDDGGAAIVEQALRYMKSGAGVAEVMHQFQGQTLDAWEETVGVGLLEAAAGTLAEALPGDLFSEIFGLLRLPLAQTAMPTGAVISGKRIALQGTASHRGLRAGRGDFNRQSTGGILNRQLFDRYLTAVTEHAADAGNRGKEDATDNTRTTALAYETEYLIAGQASDKENLEAVLTRILAMRMAVNSAYLKRDSAKQAQLEAEAAFLAMAALTPGAQPAIKEALQALWAYAESMAELRALLAGKRIAQRKQAANWKTGAAGILSLHRSVSEAWEADDVEEGLSYEDFLTKFLAAMAQETKAMRLADLIELNISNMRNGPLFQVDRAICRLQTESVAHLERAITYRYQNIFAYR